MDTNSLPAGSCELLFTVSGPVHVSGLLLDAADNVASALDVAPSLILPFLLYAPPPSSDSSAGRRRLLQSSAGQYVVYVLGNITLPLIVPSGVLPAHWAAEVIVSRLAAGTFQSFYSGVSASQLSVSLVLLSSDGDTRASSSGGITRSNSAPSWQLASKASCVAVTALLTVVVGLLHWMD